MHPLEGYEKITCECDLDFVLTCTLEHVASLQDVATATQVCVSNEYLFARGQRFFFSGLESVCSALPSSLLYVSMIDTDKDEACPMGL